jgi:hypothetical protein
MERRLNEHERGDFTAFGKSVGIEINWGFEIPSL